MDELEEQVAQVRDGRIVRAPDARLQQSWSWAGGPQRSINIHCCAQPGNGLLFESVGHWTSWSCSTAAPDSSHTPHSVGSWTLRRQRPVVPQGVRLACSGATST